MKSHSSTYEQYCYVRGGNVVFHETVRHDGARFLKFFNPRNRAPFYLIRF